MKAMFSMFAVLPNDAQPRRAPRRSPKKKQHAPCITYRPDENGQMQVAKIEVRAPKRVAALG